MPKSWPVKDWAKVNSHINRLWASLVRSAVKGEKEYPAFEDSTILYLPKPYIVPGGRFVVMFYWDSYFIIEGLKASRLKKIGHLKKDLLIKGVLENCFFQIEKFGHILNGNKQRYSTRSQPPYLTAMIKQAIEVGVTTPAWQLKAYNAAKKEYQAWVSSPHLTPSGLSRYYDHTGDPVKTRSENGWDMSPRFTDENIHELNPVDLNTNLYKYEIDLAEMANGLKLPEEFKDWSDRADRRQKKMNELMWDEKSGLFFDYNFASKTRSNVKSLASYQPMWGGLADLKQAKKLLSNLKNFQQKYGLSTCDKDYGTKDQQWNYPIGWAPLHFLVYQGLINYGYTDEARQIAVQFLNLVTRNFKHTGEVWEKYNVVSGGINVPFDRYSNQPGFGWTNGVFQKFYQDLK